MLAEIDHAAVIQVCCCSCRVAVLYVCLVSNNGSVLPCTMALMLEIFTTVNNFSYKTCKLVLHVRLASF